MWTIQLCIEVKAKTRFGLVEYNTEHNVYITLNRSIFGLVIKMRSNSTTPKHRLFIDQGISLRDSHRREIRKKMQFLITGYSNRFYRFY